MGLTGNCKGGRSCLIRWHGEELRAQHRSGADALQLPLVPRFRFRARLTAGVRRQRREGKNSKDDLFMQEERPA
jgi:hypothetical protein